VIFKSHILSMLVFAVVVSILLAFIKYNDSRHILRYALKLFLFMAGGVVLFSWFMHLA
jgi:hypothetical protein